METQEQEGPRPMVGRWYEDPLRRRFEVVGVDEEAGVIQVQYQDGETGEMELADWRHAMLDRDELPAEYLSAPDTGDER